MIRVNIRRSLAIAATAVATLSSASAAVVTFSGVPTQSGHIAGDGWWGNPSTNYQPLSGGYAIGSVTDGGDLGVTLDVTGFITDRGNDHTGDAPADYFVKGWSSATPWVMTFSAPVTISSFWQKGDYNAQASGGTFAIYAQADDTVPLATTNVINSGSGWQEITDFAGYAGEKLVLNLPSGNVLIDDMTIAVPEPAIAGAMAMGSALVMLRRRRTSR